MPFLKGPSTYHGVLDLVFYTLRNERKNRPLTDRAIWCVALLLSAVLFVALALRTPSETTDTVDSLIRQLDAPEGKVKYLFSINPGGPVFELSLPMKKLVEKGRGIQPRLLNELKDPRRR